MLLALTDTQLIVVKTKGRKTASNVLEGSEFRNKLDILLCNPAVLCLQQFFS